MAYALVQDNSFAAALTGSTNSILSSNPVTGNLVLLSVTNISASTQPGSVTDSNGNALTLLGSWSTHTSQTACGLYGYIVPATPTKSFIVTTTGTQSFDINAYEFSGGPSTITGIVDVSNSGNGAANTTGSTGPSVTTTAAGDLVFTICAISGSAGVSPVWNDSFTQALSVPATSAWVVADAYRIPGATGTFNPSVSWSNSRSWSQTTVALFAGATLTTTLPTTSRRTRPQFRRSPRLLRPVIPSTHAGSPSEFAPARRKTRQPPTLRTRRAEVLHVQEKPTVQGGKVRRPATVLVKRRQVSSVLHTQERPIVPVGRTKRVLLNRRARRVTEAPLTQVVVSTPKIVFTSKARTVKVGARRSRKSEVVQSQAKLTTNLVYTTRVKTKRLTNQRARSAETIPVVVVPPPVRSVRARLVESVRRHLPWTQSVPIPPLIPAIIFVAPVPTLVLVVPTTSYIFTTQELDLVFESPVLPNFEGEL